MVYAGGVFLFELGRPGTVCGEVEFLAFHFDVRPVLDGFWVFPVDLVHGAFYVAFGEVRVLCGPFAYACEEELSETHCFCEKKGLLLDNFGRSNTNNF